jgi:hypothetical protein
MRSITTTVSKNVDADNAAVSSMSCVSWRAPTLHYTKTATPKPAEAQANM